MIWTDRSSDRPEMGGDWVGGYGVFFLDQPECNVSEFVPVSESQTIGTAQLLAVLKALYEVTMYRKTCIMCDSEYVVNGCNGWAQKWCQNDWHTATGPVAHSDLWKTVLILLELYGPHVTVSHVPSHAGLPENEQVDTLASQGRLRSPLWTANKLLLAVRSRNKTYTLWGLGRARHHHNQLISCLGLQSRFSVGRTPVWSLVHRNKHDTQTGCLLI